MKFGKRLENEALEKFRGCYIQYKELKKALKVFAGQERDQATVQEVTHWTSSFLRLGPNPEVPPEAKLNNILQTELTRLSKVVALHEDGLRTQLTRLGEEAAKPGADKEAVRHSLEDAGSQIVELKAFAQINFTGFRKILKKYDKWSKSAVLAWFMGQVMRAPLMSVDYESLLVSLNSIAMAAAERPTRGQPAASTAAGGNEIVLLVLPKDTMEVKVQLALHLQLAGGGSAAAAAARLAPRPGGAPRPVRPRITDCYFDAPNFAVYAAYVTDEPDEEALGTFTCPPERPQPPCALMQLRDEGGERLHLVRTAFGSMKRAEVPLTRSQASDLVQGRFVNTPAAAPGARGVPTEAVLGEFRGAVAGGLRPVAQSSSRRGAFCDRSSGLTATLEEDVKLAIAQDWPSAAPVATEFLPYNVLHISCAPDDPPKWLREICDSPDVVQVQGFSLALHAIARCRLKDQSLPMPHWYRVVVDALDEDEKVSAEDEQPQDAGPPPKPKLPKPQPLETVQDESSSPSAMRSRARTTSQVSFLTPGGGPGVRLLHEFGPEPGAEDDEAAEPAADTGGGLDAPLLARPGAAAKGPTRVAIVTVQPKTLYSNERTFLEWVHFSTIFAALGLGLIHNAPRATGVIIGRGLVLLGVFLVLWALNTFQWRADALDKKEIRSYHDPLGPPLLILGMLSALVLSSLHALEVV